MEEYIWLCWDIAAVILVVYCIQKGVRYGFVRMVVSFACYIIAALTAQRYSPVLAAAIYKGGIESPLRRAVAKRLEEALAQGIGGAELVESLPGWAKVLAAAVSDTQALQTLNLGAGAERIADIVVDQVLREAVIWLLQGIVFLVIFTVLAWIIQRIARIFSDLYRIPIIGTFNCILGGTLGVLQGAVLLVVAGVAVQLLLAFLGESVWMNPQIIDSTYIFRVFYGYVLPPAG